MVRRTALAVAFLLAVTACGFDYEDAGTTTTASTIASSATIPTGPADIVFADQKVDGTTVTVESVSMPAPGFVVLRLDDGGVPGEIIGIGDVLVRGVVGNVDIPLFVPLTERILVHAGLHVDMDADGVFTYEPPDDVIDVPATSANGGDASAMAVIDLLPPIGPAEVGFDDQRIDGDVVVVASVTLPAPGFVGIWTSVDGEPEVLIGRSALLPDGTSTEVTVPLVPPVLETMPLIAGAYVDRDENEAFVPGATFDPLATTVDGLDALKTAFMTVVRVTPGSISVGSEQDDDEGDTLLLGSVVLPGPGFVEFSIAGDVIVVSDLLPAGEVETPSFEIDPLAPGDYDVDVRLFIDFDGDGVFTDLDPAAVDGNGAAVEAGFLFVVPEPPDDDA